MTIAEMATELKRNPGAVKMQLIRKKIKPKGYAGPTAIYDPSVLDTIREIAPVGRPKKNPETETSKGRNNK
ncbi:MAG: hypothetical protein LBH43_07150 [Treponema sp.]|nr:hypothetical protein [Treponema sp.]